MSQDSWVLVTPEVKEAEKRYRKRRHFVGWSAWLIAYIILQRPYLKVSGEGYMLMGSFVTNVMMAVLDAHIAANPT
jgi:hypothetical protein